MCVILGDEYNIVILSTVRSLPSEDLIHHQIEPDRKWICDKLGFLSDWHQLNVGITRAKKGLIIIGMLLIQIIGLLYVSSFLQQQINLQIPWQIPLMTKSIMVGNCNQVLLFCCSKYSVSGFLFTFAQCSQVLSRVYYALLSVPPGVM